MIPKEEHQSRMDLYRQGFSDRRIAEQVCVGKDAIVKWRRKHKLQPNFPKNRITPETEAEMRRLHREGLTDKGIAETLGLPKSTVGSWRRRKGLESNGMRGNFSHVNHHD